jgi:phosphate ABC transporter permease protein PstC
MSLLAGAAVLLVPLIAMALFLRAWPILAAKPLDELLFSSTWSPQRGAFGFLPFILGTVWVTGMAMLIAVPPSLLTAIYLAEYARPRLRAIVNPIIDLLAGIPSVVYGVWGVLTVVPFVGKHVAPTLDGWLGDAIPLFRNTNPTGYNLLSGALVLAVMVFPFIIAMAQDVIYVVPQGLREASFALGATRWQTIRGVTLPAASSGIIAAVILNVGRIIGETMAALLVVGNVARLPSPVFDAFSPGAIFTSVIAGEMGEVAHRSLHYHSLFAVGFVLLVIVTILNISADQVRAAIRKKFGGY